MGYGRNHAQRFAIGLLAALLTFCSVAAWAHASAHQEDPAAVSDCSTCLWIQTTQHSELPSANALPALAPAIGNVDLPAVVVVESKVAAPSVRGPVREAHTKSTASASMTGYGEATDNWRGSPSGGDGWRCSRTSTRWRRRCSPSACHPPCTRRTVPWSTTYSAGKPGAPS